MSERKTFNLPFDSEDPAEQKLWAMLEEMPRETPSSEMRRSFYHALDHANVTSWAARLQGWLGINSSAGWLTAAACVLVGVGLGQAFHKTDSVERNRLELLEQNVALLNRELILDRMQDATAGQRLRGVIDASSVVRWYREESFGPGAQGTCCWGIAYQVGMPKFTVLSEYGVVSDY